MKVLSRPTGWSNNWGELDRSRVDADVVEEGFQTSQEIAKELNNASLPTVQRWLRLWHAKGIVEVKYFRLRRANMTRAVPHYRRVKTNAQTKQGKEPRSNR